MLIRVIEAPFWHQRVRLSTHFEDHLAGDEGTMMGPPEVVKMELGKDNVVISYELEVPVRLDGMATISMIPIESLVLLQPEDHAQVLNVD